MLNILAYSKFKNKNNTTFNIQFTILIIIKNIHIDCRGKNLNINQSGFWYVGRKTLPTIFHLKMSAPMWKTEVEKYIKLSDNTAVEDLSNGLFYIHLCDLIERTDRCIHSCI